MMMFGREVLQPTDLMYPGAKPQAREEGYLTELREQLVIAHETARETLKTRSEYAKRNYDKGAYTKNYTLGDPVYVLNKTQKKGVCQKLTPRFEGPAIITEVKSPFIFKILMNNRTSKIVNHDSIKLCREKELPKWVIKTQESLEQTGGQTYCFCGKPYQGEFMVQCNSCLDWFHTKCAGIKKKDINSETDFICGDCLT